MINPALNFSLLLICCLFFTSVTSFPAGILLDRPNLDFSELLGEDEESTPITTTSSTNTARRPTSVPITTTNTPPPTAETLTQYSTPTAETPSQFSVPYNADVYSDEVMQGDGPQGFYPGASYQYGAQNPQENNYDNRNTGYVYPGRFENRYGTFRRMYSPEVYPYGNGRYLYSR